MSLFEAEDALRSLRKAFKAHGRAAFFGRPFRLLTEAGSTQDAALDWAAAPPPATAPEGAMVLALSQSAGRGRGGNHWVSVAGAGLWFSLVLRPDLGYPESGVVPIAMGFGLVDALRRLGIPAALKWPNDVLVRGKKVAGILVEGRSAAGRLVTAVAGIGVNWLAPDTPELAGRATGLAEEISAVAAGQVEASPTPLPPEVALVSLLAGFEKAYLLLKAAGSAPFVAGWPAVSAHFVRPVRAAGGHDALGGRLLPDGSLEVLTPDGRREHLVSSEVSLAVSPEQSQQTLRSRA